MTNWRYFSNDDIDGWTNGELSIQRHSVIIDDKIFYSPWSLMHGYFCLGNAIGCGVNGAIDECERIANDKF